MKDNDTFELKISPGLPKLWTRDLKTNRKKLEHFWLVQTILAIYLGAHFIAAVSTHHTSQFTWYLPLFYACILPIALFTAHRVKGRLLKFDRKGFSSRNSTFVLPSFSQIGKQERTWDQLECVRFQKAASLSEMTVMTAGRGDCLVLDWRGTRNSLREMMTNTTYINIEAIDAAQRERLFLTISKLIPQEVLAPEVLYLQVQSLCGAQTIDLNNYTKIWLEEYTRKFELSNYVNLTPGTVCGAGRFTITMTVAARINSSTYLARINNKENQKVIIKELVAPLDSDDSMQQKLLEQFNREAAILAKLNHPSIVKVIDHFIENGRSYIVMELADGKNMREYLRLHGKLKEPELLNVATQLIDVLSYLHHHSPPILHRDFTPDNLIYAADGSVTVVDFGAANVYNTGKTATLIGKQSYMPPEQLRGQPCPASDIYAFGATLSYLLLGKDLVSMGKLPSFADRELSLDLVTLLNDCTAFEWQGRPSCEEISKRLKDLKTRNNAVGQKATPFKVGQS